MKPVLVCGLLCLMVCKSLLAQPAFLDYNQKVSTIRLEGLSSIQQDQVYSNLSIKINQVLSPTKITDDVKALHELGFFRDIQVKIELLSPNSVALIFIFIEKPRIETISIKGSRLISATTLRKSLLVQEQNMPNFNLIRRDVETLRQAYIKKGIFNVKVLYEVEEINPENVNLTYTIFEVPRTYLTEIRIHGSQFFYPLDLERRLKSAEIDCFGWITSAGVFDQNKINVDLQIIAQLYLTSGFLKVNIKKPRIRMIHNPAFSRVVVDLYIEENDRYFTGDIQVQTRDEFPLLVEEQTILEQLSLQTGDPFNVFLVNQDRLQIDNLYQERGYAFSNIQDQIDVDEETKIAHVNFFTIRNEKTYIGRIDFAGNTITEDYVLRREFNIFDGELYNISKLRESQFNLNQLGYFELGNGIQLNRQESVSQHILDYTVQLKEKSTSSINGGIAYSNNDIFTLNVNFSSLNFLGKGWRFAINGSVSSNGDQNYSTNFYEPYFLGSKWGSTTSLFNTRSDDLGYRVTSIGIGQRFDYPFWKNWHAFGGLRIANLSFTNVSLSGQYSLGFKAHTSLRTLSTGLSYNSVDHPQFPTSGSNFSLTASQIGNFAGGQEEFQVFSSDWQNFIALNSSSTLVFMNRWRYTQLVKNNPEKNIPAYRRLYLGGLQSVRGFKNSALAGASTSIEIRKGFNVNHLSEEDKRYYFQHRGGVTSSLFNFELLFPLTREGGNIRGVVFTDVGNVWSENRMYEITGANKNYGAYRYGYGAGVRLITPFGVLRFEYGEKGNPKPGESKSIFEFYVSSLF